ncbi:nucleotidyltransferase domain protein [Clostridium tepidiprofundi DSM 19306]|uniref:Nucleotidyltransferase domain protein n=1 Tax=Clostridium tepidiprofundi DSM 19306 TaxID=1121338 RepID=A0A151B2V9_9CLOT|nr:nucleotidyltransferase domain-containing protein [Clostridium tepidiprofundi]KYH33997.1 nucleotidyltransferase domain protein [Clostridium tepidiprofundi DSM 19306]
MIQRNLEEIINITNDYLAKLVQEYNIKLMYIFGSYAKGNNTAKSDLDIAVLLGENYNPMCKLELIGELTSIFKRDDIDLVILNNANSVLKHQVIKYGKLIYMENEDIKVNFEVRVLKEYMDMEYFRKIQMKYINEWIKDTVGRDNV